MSEDSQLQEFFAVTNGGVYQVKAEKNEKGFPIVEKIKSFSRQSKVKVGDRLRNGQLVGVSAIGIILFTPGSRDHERTLEYVNTRNWGGGTSAVVGLFLDRKKAMNLNRRKKPLENCDPRWEKDTMEVLAAIGDYHDVFMISHHSAMGFENVYNGSSS